MEKTLSPTLTETLIEDYKRLLSLETRNSLPTKPSRLLSQEQWLSFVELASDLDLNDQGIKILYQEVHSGRVLLPCDRNKKMQH